MTAEILQGEIDDTETGEALSRWPDTLPPKVRRLREFRTELRELMMRSTENGISADALSRLVVTTAAGKAETSAPPAAQGGRKTKAGAKPAAKLADGW